MLHPSEGGWGRGCGQWSGHPSTWSLPSGGHHMVGVTIVCVFKKNIMSLSFWNLLQVVWCAKNKKKEIMQIILFCKARDFDFLYYFLLTRTTWKYTQKKFSLVIYELRTTISVTRLSANAFPTFSSSSHLFSKLFLSFGNLHLLLLHIRYFPSFLAPTISKAHKAWENMRRYPLLSTGPGGRDGRSSVESCQEHIYHPKCARECSKIGFFVSVLWCQYCLVLLFLV